MVKKTIISEQSSYMVSQSAAHNLGVVWHVNLRFESKVDYELRCSGLLCSVGRNLLRDNPEDRSSQPLCGGSLKLRKS